MVYTGFGAGIQYLSNAYASILMGDLTTGWNETKYNQYMVNRAVLPGYSEIADYRIGKYKNDWYMQRYGLTWDQVQQPWNLPGYNQQSSAVGSSSHRALNFVSKNIERLYE